MSAVALALAALLIPAPVATGPTAAGAPETPAVGTTRQWLGIDNRDNSVYPKTFTLRAVGAHIEVWVAQDLAFPAGDCRTRDLTPSDTEIGALVHEFDTVIYPRETAAFRVPPDRDGTRAERPGDYTGAGDRTVTLVDNIRDDNWADAQAAGYDSGTFSRLLEELVDRNVITIDSYDWAHRSGAHPPNQPSADNCTNHSARPRLYETTFAHEWQHLLEYASDPDEAVWVDEGMADYATALTGYSDPARGVYRYGFDVHLACFRGYGTVVTRYNGRPHECGGPQNSLNLWGEGAPLEVQADYGNAFGFMLYLHDRFGPEVLTRLHQDPQHQGLGAVAAALPAGTSLFDTLHGYQTAVLTARATGAFPSLGSTINLGNPDAYGRPGAAPNGADYVRLRDARGHYLRGRDLTSVTFAGAVTLPPEPLAWTAADGALFSGNASNLDARAVTAVTVPATDPVLRLDTTYGFETGFDFGYVSVSSDGGRTYVPLAGDRTGAGPLGPALTGPSDGGVTVAYDLAAYAGKPVLLQFRYVSDGTVDVGGWAVTGIRLGGTALPVTPDAFRSPTQIRPVPVAGWSARLVGMKAQNAAEPAVKEVPVRDWAQLAGYDEVVAVVACDDPTGAVTRYAPYSLTVNGVVQPGGA